MKYYIIAGEASGDLHGSNLMKALQQKDDQADFRFWGGDLMSAVGGKPVRHIRELAFMGFVEVVKNLRTILGFMKACKADITAFQPDALILIDYPGFNLRIAKWAKTQGFKIFFYISPQVWAWKAGRVPKMKRTLDKLFVILPFEKDFYKKYDFKVDFVGHPLLDVIEDAKKDIDFYTKNKLTTQPIIALLPGSRKQEIKRMLAKMLGVVNQFADYQFVIGGAPAISTTFYQKIIEQFSKKNKLTNVRLVENQTYQLLLHAKAALVTSGTATLETALFKVPQVVCYTGNPISYEIAKRIVKIDYIALVNLIMNEKVVEELIQYELTTENLQKSLQDLLTSQKRTEILADYETLHLKLGGKGASTRTATLIVENLKEQN